MTQRALLSLILMLTLAALLAACAAPATTPAAAPTATPAPKPQEKAPTPADIGLTPAGLSLDDQGLVQSWQAVLVPATPYDNMHPPGPSGLPTHIQILFDGVSVPREREPGAPVIYIIPVAAYAQLWEQHDSSIVPDMLRKIEAYTRELPDPAPVRGMPVLPVEETYGINDFVTQLRPVAGLNGFRFVGRFAMDATPLTNEGLRYIYQGLTQDGRYLVAFFFPVRTDELPDGLEAVSQEDADALQADGLGYLADKSAKLDALPGDAWEPDLTKLDALIASLKIEEGTQQ
jgi:hypothetical protein